MKVLFVAGEVAPFSDTTETSRLMRTLPERLQEFHGVEPRIIMPRYGVVSERRNRLHEVIRLSGAEIPVGDQTDTLRVKVASIPGIRLQVYFMDSVVFYKRKGLHASRDGVVFEDNPARALFLARAALSTAQKLGWTPDVVHAAGWIGALVPHVLRSDEALSSARSVYTPDLIDGYDPVLTAEDAAALGLDGIVGGQSLRAIGLTSADAVAYAPGDGAQDGEPAGPVLDGDDEGAAERAAELYATLRPALAA
ncbi:MAG TPA: glycogen/starch synthase [Rubricoccaceae bacterium]|jgi:starch synthase